MRSARSSTRPTLADTVVRLAEEGVDVFDRTCPDRLREGFGPEFLPVVISAMRSRIARLSIADHNAFPAARRFWYVTGGVVGAHRPASEIRDMVSRDSARILDIVRRAIWNVNGQHVAITRAALTHERFPTKVELGQYKEGRRKTQADTQARRTHRILESDHPAMLEHRTIFPTAVRDRDLGKNILAPGGNNLKLGAIVKVGPFAGRPIFQLTLEERATCPPCPHALDCYGNNMPNARRADIAGLGYDELAAWIDRSVFEYLTGFPQGILLRLHALGDFLPHGAGDTRYALMWSTLLSRYPGLAVFGYTHVPHASGVGRVLRAMNDEFPERSFIRFSNQPRATEFATVSLDIVPDAPTVETRGTVATVCPAQTGDSKCTDCGLCFSDDHRGAIAFVSHERLAAHARSDD